MKYRKKDMKALLPMLVALCLIAFVVLTKDYQTEFSKFDWFNSSEIDQIDSFEYTKSICVIIMGTVAALVIAVSEYRKNKKKIKNEKKDLTSRTEELFLKKSDYRIVF